MGRELYIPQETEDERQRVIRTAAEYPWRNFQGLGLNNDKVIDIQLGTLFHDLQSGRFWGPLSMINGSYNPYDPEGNHTHEKRLLRQEWAKANFSERQLQEIVQICVDSALTRRKEVTGRPGTTKPHSLLYDNLVANPDSMFGDMLTPEFVARLNNGRFWEEIPNMISWVDYNYGTATVQDVLLHHFEDLDPSFAPYGLDLFESNHSGSGDFFELHHLTSLAIRRYGQFVGKVDSRKDEFGITTEQLAPVVRPYATSVFAPDFQNGGEQPRYGDRTVARRLRQPLVQRYLVESAAVNLAVRNNIGKDLSDFRDPLSQKNAMTALLTVPNPNEMLLGIVLSGKFGKTELDRINSAAKDFGIDLSPLITPISKLIRPVA